MTIKASGTISIHDINYELGFANNTPDTSFSNFYIRQLINYTSGSISFFDFYGKYTPFILFAGGTTGSITGTSEEFRILNETRTSSTSISARTGLFGASGTSEGVFMGGDNSGALDTTETYSYTTKTVSAKSGSGVSRLIGCSSQAYNYAYFFAGLTAFSTPTNLVQEYSFSGNFYSTVTNLGVSIIQTAASFYSSGYYFLIAGGAGSSGGTAVKTAYKYSLSTEKTTTATNLGSQRKSHAACGSSSYGTFSGGISETDTVLSSTDRYTYSSDVVGSGSTLVAAKYGLAATGNEAYGYFSGGFASSSPLSSMDRYEHSSNSRQASTALGTAKYGHAGVCTAAVGVL